MLHRFLNPMGMRDPKAYASLAPLCGQKDRQGKGWARSGCTDKPEQVTCRKCLAGMSDAVTGHQRATAEQGA